MDYIKLEMNNLTEEERKQLMALVEKANKTKRWKPQMGEQYWYVTDRTHANHYAWENDGADQKIYASHNCFRTEAEAEFEVEKRRVYNELLTYAEEHNECEIDWGNDNQAKVNIRYSHFGKTIKYDSMYDNQYTTDIYFTSIKIARDAVKAVGEERIKKYLFGVGDTE